MLKVRDTQKEIANMYTIDFYRYNLDPSSITFESITYDVQFQSSKEIMDLKEVFSSLKEYLKDHFGKVVIRDGLHKFTINNDKEMTRVLSKVDKLIPIKRGLK